MEATASLELPRRATVTERNWLRAAALVVGSILLFALIGWVEQAWTGRYKTERLVYHPVETSMRFLAIPHFLIAIMFTLSSRRLRRPGTAGRFLMLAAAGVGLCLLFREAGGREAFLAKTLFFLYFLVHEFRDEASFYVANGDAPSGVDPRRLSREVLLLPALLLLLGATGYLLAVTLGIGRAGTHATAIFGDLPAAVRQVAGSLPLVATLLWGWHRFGRGGRSLAYWRAHRPLVTVFVGILLLILLDLLLHGRVRALITLHVTAWYAFTLHQLARRPSPATPPRPWSWTWVRTTPRGFSCLHIGLFLAVLLGAALWAYGFRNSPERTAFHLLLSRDAFPYWTIMHISLSFLPKG